MLLLFSKFTKQYCFKCYVCISNITLDKIAIFVFKFSAFTFLGFVERLFPLFLSRTPLSLFVLDQTITSTSIYSKMLYDFIVAKVYSVWQRILLNASIFTFLSAERRIKCDEINTWQKQRYSLRLLSVGYLAILYEYEYVHHLNTEYSHNYQLRINIP